MDSITKELTTIINRILESKGSRELKLIKNETDLRNDLGFDSFDLAELTVLIEHKFGVDVFEDGIVNTIEEVIRKIEVK